jgi:hypothetical protein
MGQKNWSVCEIADSECFAISAGHKKMVRPFSNHPPVNWPAVRRIYSWACSMHPEKNFRRGSQRNGDKVGKKSMANNLDNVAFLTHIDKITDYFNGEVQEIWSFS